MRRAFVVVNPAAGGGRAARLWPSLREGLRRVGLEFEAAELQAVSFAGSEVPADSGPREAIAIYEQLLTQYPNYERADQVLYQMARAYDELGETEEAMAITDRLIAEYGYSKYLDEIQFRRGEYFFTRRRFREAEQAYQVITERQPDFTASDNKDAELDASGVGYLAGTSGYVRLDARITLTSPDERWAIDLIGKNLTDRNILTSGGFGTATKQPPRNVAIQFRYYW